MDSNTTSRHIPVNFVINAMNVLCVFLFRECVLGSAFIVLREREVFSTNQSIPACNYVLYFGVPTNDQQTYIC